MSHLKYISFNKFRVFGTKEKLELRPITFLTGPNSSGKSSVLKSLLLLKNNSKNDLQVLDFTGPKHNLGTFDNTLNNSPDSKIMTFGFEASVLSDDHGFMSSTLIQDRIATKRGVYNVLKEFSPDEDTDIFSDIYLELSYVQNERSGKLYSVEMFLKNDDTSFLKLTLGAESSENHILKFDYPKVIKNKFLKGLFIDEVLRQRSKIKNPRKATTYRIDSNEFIGSTSSSFFNEPTAIFGRLYALFLEENSDIKQIKPPHDFIIRQPFKRVLKDFASIIENTEYLEAVRANTQRLYTNDSQGTSFNDLILEYRSRDISKKSIEFTNKWLKKFEIADSIEFKNIEGVATTIYFKRGEIKIALADLGYGITQFLPILLKIALEVPVSDKNSSFQIVKKLILLEEPETNLHPKLQSLIADFLVDALKTFEVRFIIETHSEYLIRKIQLLTAEKIINTSDTILYYFNSAESVENGLLNTIRINENGSLSSEFGSGFYDEATALKLELLKKKNSNA
jgi:predicted ATP-dependent endonuclease of OLD family